MLFTTTNQFDGYEVSDYLGIVRGLIVRSPTITQGISSFVQRLTGGNIQALTEMCEQARQHAFDLMCDHAKELRADGVAGIHYESTELGSAGGGTITEVICYGTAVKLERIK